MSHQNAACASNQPAGPLHCVVIGHNDVNFATFAENQMQFAARSAAYNEVVTNSVCVSGRRRSYMELLNVILSRGSGTPHDLNTFKVPSLAVAYLVNFLRKRGLGAEGVNFFNADRDRLLQALARDPICVAITTTYYVDDDPIREIVMFIRRHNPAAKIVV